MRRQHDEERSSALWIAAWFAIMGALILFGCVNESKAATLYVSASGSSTGADSSHAMSLSSFNTTATSGDVAILLGGNYGSQRIQPVANGLTYRGLSGNPNDVTIGQIAETGSRADSLVTIKYVTSVGNFSLVGSTNELARWRVVSCNITGTFQLGNLRDSRFDSLTVAYGSSTNAAFGINVYGGVDSARYSRRDTVNDSRFTFSSIYESGSGTACVLFGGYDNRLARCAFTIASPTGADVRTRAVRFNYCERLTTVDCSWRVTNNFTSFGDETMSFSLKDGAKWNHFTRDTLIMSGNDFSSGGHPEHPWIDMAQNETDGNVPPSMKSTEGIGGNSWRNCYIANRTGATYGVIMYTGGVDGDSISGCTIVSNGGPFRTFYASESGAALDRVSAAGTVFDHNLFATFANGPAVTFDNRAADEAVKFTNNIFYAPNYTGSGGVVSFGRASDWGSAAVGPVANNYNLSYGGLSSASHSASYSGGTSAYGTSGAWYLARSGIGVFNDVNSQWGRPAFTDSTSAAFDAHPLASSAALFGPDGYVGPFAYSSGSTFTITASAGSGGTIAPTGSVSVASGASQTFTITPNAHYHVAGVTVDAAAQGAITSYTFNNVLATHTISATFALDTLAITASAGANGSISPSGTKYVNYGASQTFTITPNASYHILTVTVDGVNVGAPSSYTFTNVTTTHTISATFSLTQYTIWSQAFPGGSMSPSGTTTVNEGDAQAFTITADPGYHVADVLADGNSVGAVTAYTFSSITSSHTLEAYFAAASTYPITVTQATGGTISPSGVVSVASGADQTFTITPAIGYYVRSLIIDGVPATAATSYTFTNVTAAHTISAAFEVVTAASVYLLGGTGGTISPSGTVQTTVGSPRSFIVIPNRLRRVRAVYVDGVNVGAVTSYTIPSVNAATSVYATFTDSIGAGNLFRRRRR